MLRMISGAIALIVGAALGLLSLTSQPASATPLLSASITCLDTDGYQVDWRLDNTQSASPMTVAVSSDSETVPPATAVSPGSWIEIPQVVTAPHELTLTLQLEWEDGTSVTATSTVGENRFPVSCAPNPVPVTLCHATPPDTAADGWQAITIDDDAVVKQGHGYQHAADIIPAFVYWVHAKSGWTQESFPGLNLTTLFSGVSGQAILDAGCVLPPGPIVVTPAVSAQGQQCVDGHLVNGTITATVTPGVLYSARDSADVAIPLDPVTGSSAPVPPGVYTVEVVVAPGYVLSDPGPFSVTVTAFDGPCGELPSHPLVIPLVAATQATCTSSASYTLANDLGEPGSVIWTVDGVGVVEATYGVTVPNRVAISAAPADGFGFAEGTQSTWEIDFAAPTGCELSTLAVTGVGQVGWIAFATLLFGLGVVLIAFEGRARWRASVVDGDEI